MSEEPATAPSGRKWLLLPAFAFAVLAAIFLLRIDQSRDSGGNISKLPSALIGKPAPATALPPLQGLNLPGLDPALFKGGVTLVNIFASWCGPCRDEHPELLELAKRNDIRLIGFNYKDKDENARRFLGSLGNPYMAVGVDPSGRAGVEWGVYGVPETFVIAPDGTIAYKHVGPITPAIRTGKLAAAITAAAQKK
jgi:cytochrome c biogenesis protein CcmG/thiol:disulfide interchange protein DsbE